MITCPFKYSERYTYCNCPYPKGEVDWMGPFVSLEQMRIQHMIEIDEASKNKEGER